MNCVVLLLTFVVIRANFCDISFSQFLILVSVNSFFYDSGTAAGLDKVSINSRAVMEDIILLVLFKPGKFSVIQ